MEHVQELEVQRKMVCLIVRWVGGGGTKYLDLETAVADLVGAEVDTVIEWLELLREAVRDGDDEGG